MKKTLFSAFAIILMIMLNSPSQSAILLVNNEVTPSTEIKNTMANDITPDDAKTILLEGNKRFVKGNISKKDMSLEKRKELNEKGQFPSSIIVSCSDSRVPPELVFDQGLGDLFVARNAGNVSDEVVLGTAEYAVNYLHTPLIVVMGHENCGAVKAVVEGLKVEGSLNSILNKIRPVCESLKPAPKDKEKLLDECIDANIKNTISQIRKSPSISRLEKEGKLKVIGAKYHMESGIVEFQ